MLGTWGGQGGRWGTNLIVILVHSLGRRSVTGDGSWADSENCFCICGTRFLSSLFLSLTLHHSSSAYSTLLPSLFLAYLSPLHFYIFSLSISCSFSLYLFLSPYMFICLFVYLSLTLSVSYPSSFSFPSLLLFPFFILSRFIHFEGGRVTYPLSLYGSKPNVNQHYVTMIFKFANMQNTKN